MYVCLFFHTFVQLKRNIGGGGERLNSFRLYLKRFSRFLISGDLYRSCLHVVSSGIHPGNVLKQARRVTPS